MAAIDAKPAPASGQISGPLALGLNVIDQNQEVAFTLYYRRVHPLDGSIFWVNSGLIDAAATTFNARGSLHHTTTNTQDPDDSMSIHRIVFTSLTEIDNLSAIAPTTIWLGTIDGQRFAFSTRSGWYKQAALYHYSGDATYPSMSTQIVETLEELDLEDLIVSNSLPIWLTLNSLFPVYPSYLVPDNLDPPYASVHIGEDDTTVLTAGPTYSRTGTRSQLSKDAVKVTMYGVRNDMAMDFLDLVRDYTFAHSDTMGVMNTPLIKDAKRAQVEISTIAQKKVAEFHVDYYQNRSRDIARKLITEALIGQFIVQGL